jgi:hypothetical protein
MRNKNKIARTSLALEFATLTSAFILFFERAIEKTRTITGEYPIPDTLALRKVATSLFLKVLLIQSVS